MNKKLQKLQLELIRFEHGRPPKAAGFKDYSCECWPIPRVKKLLKIINNYLNEE